MVWESIVWAAGKIMERKWFGPPLFARGGGNNGWKTVWASIIWAGEKIMDGKWFGSPLFLRVRPASDASVLLQLLLDQNDALQERVVNLEKSRTASAISAHTALEAADNDGNAADGSQPGGLPLAQF